MFPHQSPIFNELNFTILFLVSFCFSIKQKGFGLIQYDWNIHQKISALMISMVKYQQQNIAVNKQILSFKKNLVLTFIIKLCCNFLPRFFTPSDLCDITVM